MKLLLKISEANQLLWYPQHPRRPRPGAAGGLGLAEVGMVPGRRQDSSGGWVEVPISAPDRDVLKTAAPWRLRAGAGREEEAELS